ncbi:MAG: M20 family metallopeptidase [Desulfobacteraceae bacterium]|nr:M20 family metallopeptidase [Desulfobacteraceae bacterium]
MDAQQQIKTFINQNKSEMLTLLENLVCIQSGSKNKSGIDKVGRFIQKEMESMGFCCERVRQKTFGDHIIARSFATDQNKNQILITGHMDTVFPYDTNFIFFNHDNTKCYGPGVADMKGGLVVGIFALKALLNSNCLKNLPITFIFNSDEEIGSPSSRKIIRSEAKKSKMAFVFEAGGLNGEIVTGRKGNFSAQLEIQGEAGHAAFANINKASAILELAQKIIAIEKLNSMDLGISANIGTVQGGIGPNTIPEHAKAQMDFRFLTSKDFERLKSQVQVICNNYIISGTTSVLKIVSSRPAMPQTSKNIALYDRIKIVADDLNIPIISELRQGASDANLIADEGIPVIDGLGPIGAKDHSEDEYINTQSLLDRAILFASFLLSISIK